MAWQGQSGPEDSVGGIAASVALDTTQIDPGVEGLKRRLDELGVRLQALGPVSATSTTAVAASMAKVVKEARAAGYRMQIFAQTFDDLAYVPEQGLRPILNNLVQFSPVLGVVAIAVDQVVKSMGGWKKVMSELGLASPIEKAAEEMKRLAAETERTANEQDRLNRLQKGQTALEAVRGGESKADKATAAAVQEAVDEADFRTVRDAVMAARKRDGLAPRMTPEDEAALERERVMLTERPTLADPLMLRAQAGQVENIAKGYGADAQKAITDRLAREANAAAESLIAEAKLSGAAGEAARKQLEKYAQEDPRLRDFGRAIRDAPRAAGAAERAAAEDRFESEGVRAAQKDQADREARETSELEAEQRRVLFGRKVMEDRVAEARGLGNAIMGGAEGQAEEERGYYARLRRIGERLGEAMNPYSAGATHTADQFEATVKGQTRDPTQEAIRKAVEETRNLIRDRERNVKVIAVKKR